MAEVTGSVDCPCFRGFLLTQAADQIELLTAGRKLYDGCSSLAKPLILQPSHENLKNNYEKECHQILASSNTHRQLGVGEEQLLVLAWHADICGM